MDQDLKRLIYFAKNDNIILPIDEDTLPLSVDTEQDNIYWIGFESPELGQQSSSLDPTYYQWGQMNGLQYLKFLNERIEAGGKHVLLINPDTDRQIGLNNQSVQDFLFWLTQNPIDQISL